MNVEDIRPKMWVRLRSGRNVQVLEARIGILALEFLCADWDNQEFAWWDPDYIQPLEEQ